jgi:tripartite-type tricarboxylate transporter receptor subunit TctC
MLRQQFSISVCFLSGILFSPYGGAQIYPSKPIRIITSEAGGGLDFVTRLLAQGISSSLGQIIVDNRPGDLSGELASKAAPDGYTLLLMGNPIWIVPLMRTKVTYDPLKDLSPITQIGVSPSILVVHPSLPVRSVRDLIELARAKPGELNYAFSGTGGASQLAGKLFNSMAGVNMVDVPYKGGGPAILALIGGQVQLEFPTLASVSPHIKSGKLRAIAVTSAQPSALLPSFPTIAAILPGYEAVTIYGMFAPATTAESVISRLNQEVVQYMDKKDVKDKLYNVGVEPVSSSPQQLSITVKSEIAKWSKVIKDANIRAD